MSEATITNWLSRADLTGPASCAVCGCRLTEIPGEEGRAWRHFPSPTPGHDARGCRPRCVDEPHDRDGRVRGILSQVAGVVAAAEARHRAGRSNVAAEVGVDDDPCEEEPAA